MKYSFVLLAGFPLLSFAQLNWKNVDSLFQPLPQGFHVYCTNDSLDGKPNIAYYAIAELKNKHLQFMADTTTKRRLTPAQYFEKNNHPLLVVNTTFFEFTHSKNLNTVIHNKKLLGYNVHSIPLKGKDTLLYQHSLGSAIGISKKRTADIAWLYTDSSYKKPFAFQQPVASWKDSFSTVSYSSVQSLAGKPNKWKMQTAVGGGPVLLQNGELFITNMQELKFSGKTGLTDKHPRTAMGYTADGKLIVLVIQGRFPKLAEGATLEQEARMLQQLGCIEALNLDGGGSSCMLINGKQTITPSDKEGQRAVPCVFMIKAN